MKITTLPAAGTLTDNGVAVTAGQFIPVADITGGMLKFTPAANANGAPTRASPSKSRTTVARPTAVSNLDASANTMTINVTVGQRRPGGDQQDGHHAGGHGLHIHGRDFGFTDPNDTPANNLLAVKITTLPAAGTLTDNGVAVTAGQFIPVADITGGKLKFTPAANANGAAYASFTFQVQDDGGTANGGVDLDPSPKTITINVTAVNDAPAGTDKTVTTLEDTAYTFTAADFGFSDPNDSPANTLLAVKITTLPTAGTLDRQWRGRHRRAVRLRRPTSQPASSSSPQPPTPTATTYASFTFQVQDNGGTANGGVDLDPIAQDDHRQRHLRSTTPRRAPTRRSPRWRTRPTRSRPADFGFSDPNDTPANNLLAVKITTLPAAGTLTDNGVAVTAGQFIPVADITGGLLKFTPAANANGAAYASFTFQVQDDGGTANGGVDLDPRPRP